MSVPISILRRILIAIREIDAWLGDRMEGLELMLKTLGHSPFVIVVEFCTIMWTFAGNMIGAATVFRILDCWFAVNATTNHMRAGDH